MQKNEDALGEGTRHVGRNCSLYSGLSALLKSHEFNYIHTECLRFEVMEGGNFLANILIF